MNPVHLHLLLNHFPTVGFSIGLALFLVGLVAKRDQLQRVSLVIFFLTAALTITTYVSGSDAQEALKETPDLPTSVISAHETAALLAFAFMQATGFFSWLALWMWRGVSRVANWNLAVVLVLAIVSFGLMARAANIGGEIRHAEIQSTAEKVAAANASDEPSFTRSW